MNITKRIAEEANNMIKKHIQSYCLKVPNKEKFIFDIVELYEKVLKELEIPERPERPNECTQIQDHEFRAEMNMWDTWKTWWNKAVFGEHIVDTRNELSNKMVPELPEKFSGNEIIGSPDPGARKWINSLIDYLRAKK